jgi:hydrocephalus-inducing protein
VAIKNLDPAAEKLIIELNGETERPICHFEIPPSKYREKKPDI